MAYTPLFSEILQKVGKLKTKKQKIDYLRENNTDALRMVGAWEQVPAETRVFDASSRGFQIHELSPQWAAT